MIFCKRSDSIISSLPPVNMHNMTHDSKWNHTIGFNIYMKAKHQNYVGINISTASSSVSN